MISSILASDKDLAGLKRAFWISLFLTAFCAVFYLIYNIFSHGVHSPYMTFLFVRPLILCALPAGLQLLVRKLPGPSLLSFLTWNTGAAAVTCSSLLRGIFEIAGNYSAYQAVLMNIGLALLVCGFLFYIAGIIYSRFSSL